MTLTFKVHWSHVSHLRKDSLIFMKLLLFTNFFIVSILYVDSFGFFPFHRKRSFFIWAWLDHKMTRAYLCCTQLIWDILEIISIIETKLLAIKTLEKFIKFEYCIPVYVKIWSNLETGTHHNVRFSENWRIKANM